MELRALHMSRCLADRLQSSIGGLATSRLYCVDELCEYSCVVKGMRELHIAESVPVVCQSGDEAG